MICLIAPVKKFKVCRLSASSAFLPITYFWFLTSVLNGWFSRHIAARLFLTTSSQRSVPTYGLESNSCLCPGTLRHACVHLLADQSLLSGSHEHGRQIFFSSGSGSMQLLHQVCGMVPWSKPAFLVSGISPFILQLQFKSRSVRLKFSLAIGAEEGFSIKKTFRQFWLLILSSRVNALAQILRLLVD